MQLGRAEPARHVVRAKEGKVSPWNQKVSSREAWERAAEMHLSLLTCGSKRRLLGDHWRGGGRPVASAARSWWERSARSTRRRSSDLWRARHRVNCIFSARGESEGTGRVCHQMVESPCSTSSATSCWMYTMRPQRNPRQAALLSGAQLLARESASSIIWLSSDMTRAIGPAGGTTTPSWDPKGSSESP